MLYDNIGMGPDVRGFAIDPGRLSGLSPALPLPKAGNDDEMKRRLKMHRHVKSILQRKVTPVALSSLIPRPETLRLACGPVHVHAIPDATVCVPREHPRGKNPLLHRRRAANVVRRPAAAATAAADPPAAPQALQLAQKDAIDEVAETYAPSAWFADHNRPERAAMVHVVNSRHAQDQLVDELTGQLIDPHYKGKPNPRATFLKSQYPKMSQRKYNGLAERAASEATVSPESTPPPNPTPPPIHPFPQSAPPSPPPLAKSSTSSERGCATSPPWPCAPVPRRCFHTGSASGSRAQDAGRGGGQAVGRPWPTGVGVRLAQIPGGPRGRGRLVPE